MATKKKKVIFSLMAPPLPPPPLNGPAISEGFSFLRLPLGQPPKTVFLWLYNWALRKHLQNLTKSVGYIQWCLIMGRPPKKVFCVVQPLRGAVHYAKALSPPPPLYLCLNGHMNKKVSFFFFMYKKYMFLKRERPETDDFVIKSIWLWRKNA